MRSPFAILTLAALATAVLVPAPAPACPFCTPQGQTLSGEVAQADFILYGTLANAKRDPNSLDKGTTDLTVEAIIKPHEFTKDKKVVTIPRFVPPDPKSADLKYLVFFNIFNNQLDPYRGEQVKADSKMPDYLKGALGVRQKDTTTRLRYFFDYLESPDLVISTDAYAEFGYADYKEVRPVADKLPADTLLKWLKDPNTRPSRFGLYGLLAGHCGKPEDAKTIRALLDDPERSYTSGLDGMLAGYVMLDPKAGWEYLLATIRDQKKEFPVRYAALKTVRFFWEYRPDVVKSDRVLDAMRLLIAQPDLADLPVEDLRKWGCWQTTDEVLALAAKESHNTIPIVNRAILKFALSASAKNQAAAEFVKKAREKDPKKVEFLEDLLKDEPKQPATTDPAATPPPAPPAK